MWGGVVPGRNKERERDKEKVLDAIHKYKRYQQNIAYS